MTIPLLPTRQFPLELHVLPLPVLSRNLNFGKAMKWTSDKKDSFLSVLDDVDGVRLAVVETVTLAMAFWTNGSTSCGAQRVEVKTFHVAGISLDCSAADVISYCRRKKVLATACNLLHSRIWGTQSAKLYVPLSHEDLVASSGFWQGFVRCRPWERKPPKSAGALSSKDCPSASPQ